MAARETGRFWGIAFAAGLAAIAIAALIFSIPGGNADKQPLRVFCGAASKPAMEECAVAFEKKTGVGVELQFGGSGTMLSQLKMAKRGDIFIPGSPDYMAKAKREGVVDPDKVKILVYLVPAILVQKGNPKGIESLDVLAEPGITVGIGNPEAVCVGLYAVEVLERSGLLEKAGKNVAVHAESCSKTASLIVMKKVDAIIGWRVFSRWNPDAIDAVLLDPGRIPRLSYIPAGICTTSQDPQRAEQFIEFLISSEGARIFGKWGYIATEQEARKFAPMAQVGGEYELPAGYRNLTD
ncbi:MAG: molybdate ABC transporter substrate-binding protein [Phycisphaerales bacterium]|jgi:molybdate transport system substrate-binding protein